MIGYLKRWWLDWRRPYSVALRGCESGTVYPAAEFLRFRTRKEADYWIILRELTGSLDLCRGRLTEWIVVDLRLPEQDPVIG